MKRPEPLRRSVIMNADDFGADEFVNEAVEVAHQEGVLGSASLMVSGRACDDAVQRAKRNPGLKIGLHVTVVDAAPVAPSHEILRLLNRDGALRRDLFRASLNYKFDPQTRRQLRHEVSAQFRKFKTFAIPLDHVNVHKHLQLHPVVLDIVHALASEYGSPALRVPFEPSAIVGRAEERRRSIPLPNPMELWARRQRNRARARGVFTNDYIFGLAWSGSFGEEKLAALIPHIPRGVSEIYFHPTVKEADGQYARICELQALTSQPIRKKLEQYDIRLSTYSELKAQYGAE